ncbi:glycoside hydrolase family 3 protein [Cohnella mopanensis]|uniref:glycoside hydrolase family 3 protein n=1 Tax=Cohnella mopanensis TaxID=2911966 RepID=UPI001EF7599C|nr:glycoside hydrolase family 3 N-terminal domain-containing protein [Cohnella mopanensis]
MPHFNKGPRYIAVSIGILLIAIIAMLIWRASANVNEQSGPETESRIVAASSATVQSTQAPDSPTSTGQSTIDFGYRDATLPTEQRVELLIRQMTLPEKLAQMVQAERKTITPEEMTEYGVGSILSAGGSAPSPNDPSAWLEMIDGFQRAALQSRLGIPMLYAIDAVHGNNNVYGATLFPHNIGLGATRDADLVRRIGEATALELRATGIPWNFAPCLCVPEDERWGRTYEGYGETPELVAKLGAAYVTGLQGAPNSNDWLGDHRAIATLKHWIGDGATQGGIDRGDAELSEDELRQLIAPYAASIEAGAQSVMVSFSSINGVKMHGHTTLINGVLKGQLSFKGIVVSDYNGIEEMEPDFTQAVKRGVLAGIDVFMQPDNWKGFINTLQQLVEKGEVPEERIDDAVRRILRVKFESRLFDNPMGDFSLAKEVGSQAHRELAREAAAKSLVLLKNDKGTLPLDKKLNKIAVVGSMADDIGGQSGGWSIQWQGQLGEITPGTTILQAIEQAVSPETIVAYDPAGTDVKGADSIVAVLGESPYAEGAGDSQELRLSKDDIELLNRISKFDVPITVILLSGRPLILTDELKKMDALVAAWLPGTEGSGIGDVLFGDRPFTGKLPITWPRSIDQIPIATKKGTGTEQKPLFEYGYGLTTTTN